ncbi:hypothetical protein CTheo_7751 [Ceratobasidium theobromae]|uniref:NACHT domain-containing protein n=1 Tax=Ceratobasidium theobromae TaxID=1582974 RepID=A0A5N5QAZ3_9AGAM|nr:hypothetical protein CTheo_7751 [Ceratobasidium theobromae]
MDSTPPSNSGSRKRTRSYLNAEFGKVARSRSASPSPRASADPALLPTAHHSSRRTASYSHSNHQQTLNDDPATIVQPSTGPSIIQPPMSARSTSSNTQVPHSDSGQPATPTRPITQAAKKTGVSGLKTALGALRISSKLFPPLQPAVDVLILGLDGLSLDNDRQEFKNMVSELETLSKSLAWHMQEATSVRMSDSIAKFAPLVVEQTKLINEKRSLIRGKRFTEANKIEEEILRCYREIESLFRHIQNEAMLGIWNAVDEQIVRLISQGTRLERLMPAKMAKYDSSLSTEISRRTCTEGTRTSILASLNGWTDDPGMPPIYWIDGMAGTGKTTIACTFSEQLEKRKQLGASFFCTRTSAECRDANRIIPTIAYQLAQYSVPFQSALCEVLSYDRDIASAKILKQFERLLKEPLMRVKDAIPGNLVVVIDALDECENRNGVGLILDVLLEFADDLPLRFLVSSRPEPEVYNKMLPQGSNTRAVLHLHEIEKSLVRADIELYLTEELFFMPPTPPQIQRLARQSGKLFIYAATLVRYVRHRKRSIARKRLDSILSMTTQSTKQYAEIDLLYTTILKTALEGEGLEAEEVKDLRLVLWTIICAQEPINIETLALLIGQDEPDTVEDALQSLLSVLHFSQNTRLVSTLHASFPDFMFNAERSGPYFCNRAEHSQLLACQCFGIMKSQLRFNICNLESSFLPDTDVEDLRGKINNTISPSLAYSCRHWANHLQLAATSEDLYQAIFEFLSVRLLFWMEVMNLNQETTAGAEALLKAKLWLRERTASPGLVRLAQDSENFVASFAANPVSESTPHIYVSLLPLCSKSSSVYQHYWKRMQGLVEVSGSVMEHREFAPLASWHVSSPVWSLAYSPDGTRLAYGCEDGTIAIRNAYDGIVTAGPWKGHTERTTSLAFSPDGTLLASGSYDHTIRVWMTRGGKSIGDPIKTHTVVWSVVFLPDGVCIAASLANSTVQIWNSRNGLCTGGPFGPLGLNVGGPTAALSPDGTHFAYLTRGSMIAIWKSDDEAPSTNSSLQPYVYGLAIRSLALSPKGTHIASISSDDTLQIWELETSTPRATHRVHRSKLTPVVFSPDSTRIASSSTNNEIQIWRTADGTLIAGPFERHNNEVQSVSFSPDGTRIASGALDCTIQVWNTQAGVLDSASFQGNGGRVLSVTFSPDGQRIMSISDDCTIRVWNAQNAAPLPSPAKGPFNEITLVAFSSDGTLLVAASSSNQGSIVCVWSTLGGAIVAGPFHSHRGIRSLAFSPNSILVAFSLDNATICVRNIQEGDITAGQPRIFRNVVNPWPPACQIRADPSIAFSPDNAFIASSNTDGGIRVWSVSTTDLVHSFVGHIGGCINSIAFSPDSTRIASGSSDKTIQVWDIPGRKFVAGPFKGHTKSVKSIAFSPDGMQIVSCSDDRTIWLWNARNGTPIWSLLCAHPPESVVFSPDGTRLVSYSIDKTIEVWDLRYIPHAHPSASDLPTAHPPISDLALASYLRNSTVRDDRWMVDNHGRLLFWLPPDLAHSLPTLQNPVRIGPSSSLGINYNGALLGDQWDRCYISEI